MSPLGARSAAGTSALLLTATVAGGCASGPEDGAAALRQRPSIEEISDRYGRMQQELRDRLAAELGVSAWVNDGEASRAGCADFPGIQEAESRTLDRWTYEANIADERWPEAVRVAAEVTAGYGFGAPRPVVDRPDDHEVEATDGFAAVYRFGTAKNTILSLSTGCHLPQGSLG
ncbi:hypothetical protein HUO13_05090 [Saccharopolyspora erythraea]|uniref:LppA family lipoprotein n=1 Tax=Saccharopolyspora erythraea TaxID=1836 RepID=UPI001BAAE70F|nr:LppA family lipoprotein [Saccharopolyspora erythraea]QUH00271.1 hypothetical protein HUO13_05090 [Saccharopolyspora erythraea]